LNVFFNSVTPRPTLRRSQLIHLRNSLLELLVLALLVTMSLGLYLISLYSQDRYPTIRPFLYALPLYSSLNALASNFPFAERPWKEALGTVGRIVAAGRSAKDWSKRGSTHLAFPRQVVLLISTSIQWDEQTRTAIAVCQWQSSFGHCFSGRSYLHELVSMFFIPLTPIFLFPSASTQDLSSRNCAASSSDVVGNWW
jgi:hypothetical protein